MKTFTYFGFIVFSPLTWKKEKGCERFMTSGVNVSRQACRSISVHHKLNYLSSMIDEFGYIGHSVHYHILSCKLEMFSQIITLNYVGGDIFSTNRGP